MNFKFYFFTLSLFVVSVFCSTISAQVVDGVGIGTDRPTETLDINGTLRIRQINEVGSMASAMDSIMVFDENGVVKRVSAAMVVAAGGGTPGSVAVVTDGLVIQGDGTSGNGIKLLDGVTAGQILQWDGSKWALTDFSNNQTLTSLVANSDGTFTYKDEDGTDNIIRIVSTNANNLLQQGNDNGLLLVSSQLISGDANNAIFADAVGKLYVSDLASAIKYDNSTSGIGAINVQAALDSIAARTGNVNLVDNNDGTYSFTNNDGTDVTIDTKASSNPYDNSSSGLNAENVQDAIDEVAGNESDDQILSTDGTAGNITIESGNTISLNVNDGDADATNEIQALSISGSDLSLSNGGGTVTLPSADGSETAVTGSGINTVTGSGTTADPYVVTGTEVDGSVTNEVNTGLTLSGNTLTVSDANSDQSTNIAQDVPNAGEVLTWDGAQWLAEPNSDTKNEQSIGLNTDKNQINLFNEDGTTINTSVKIAQDTPAEDEVLTWDGTQWMASPNEAYTSGAGAPTATDARVGDTYKNTNDDTWYYYSGATDGWQPISASSKPSYLCLKSSTPNFENGNFENGLTGWTTGGGHVGTLALEAAPISGTAVQLDGWTSPPSFIPQSIAQEIGVYSEGISISFDFDYIARPSYAQAKVRAQLLSGTTIVAESPDYQTTSSTQHASGTLVANASGSAGDPLWFRIITTSARTARLDNVTLGDLGFSGGDTTYKLKEDGSGYINQADATEEKSLDELLTIGAKTCSLNETITTLVDNADGTITYTNEAGAETIISTGGSSLPTLYTNAIANAPATGEDGQTLLVTSDGTSVGTTLESYEWDGSQWKPIFQFKGSEYATFRLTSNMTNVSNNATVGNPNGWISYANGTYNSNITSNSNGEFTGFKPGVRYKVSYTVRTYDFGSWSSYSVYKNGLSIQNHINYVYGNNYNVDESESQGNFETFFLADSNTIIELKMPSSFISGGVNISAATTSIRFEAVSGTLPVEIDYTYNLQTLYTDVIGNAPSGNGPGQSLIVTSDGTSAGTTLETYEWDGSQWKLIYHAKGSEYATLELTADDVISANGENIGGGTGYTLKTNESNNTAISADNNGVFTGFKEGVRYKVSFSPWLLDVGGFISYEIWKDGSPITPRLTSYTVDRSSGATGTAGAHEAYFLAGSNTQIEFRVISTNPPVTLKGPETYLRFEAVSGALPVAVDYTYNLETLFTDAIANAPASAYPGQTLIVTTTGDSTGVPLETYEWSGTQWVLTSVANAPNLGYATLYANNISNAPATGNPGQTLLITSDGTSAGSLLGNYEWSGSQWVKKDKEPLVYHANFNAVGSYSTNSLIPFVVTPITNIGNQITYNSTTREFTLPAGRTYKLSSSLITDNGASSYYRFYQNGAGYIGSGGASLPLNSTGSFGNGPQAVAFISTTTPVTVSLRVSAGTAQFANLNTSAGTYSYVIIETID